MTDSSDPLSAPKKAHRNGIVKCQKCSLELPRKKLKKHKLSTHTPQKELMILNKVATKSSQIRACANCSAQGEDTWVFERTTRGVVNLCLSCKTRVLKLSFSSKGVEKRRLISLKATLQELRQRKAKLSANIIDIELSKNIKELEDAIKRPSQPKNIWSPILPGSFEGGKHK